MFDLKWPDKVSLCILDPTLIPLGKKKQDLLLKQQIGFFGQILGPKIEGLWP